MNSTDFKVEHEQLCHSSGKAEIQLLVIDTSKERDRQINLISSPVLHEMTVKLPRISVQLSHDVRVVQQFFEALAELNIRVQPETKNQKT